MLRDSRHVNLESRHFAAGNCRDNNRPCSVFSSLCHRAEVQSGPSDSGNRKHLSHSEEHKLSKHGNKSLCEIRTIKTRRYCSTWFLFPVTAADINAGKLDSKSVTSFFHPCNYHFFCDASYLKCCFFVFSFSLSFLAFYRKNPYFWGSCRTDSPSGLETAMFPAATPFPLGTRHVLMYVALVALRRQPFSSCKASKQTN